MQLNELTRVVPSVALAVALATPAIAETTAVDVMKRSEAVQDAAEDRIATMTMTLINKRGDTRMRSVVSFSRNYDQQDESDPTLDSKSIMFFVEPADVKDTGFLQFGRKQVDDDQWLYLPALKKVRKIKSSSKSKSFMGTEFSYDDMSTRDVEEDDHRILEESAKGWVIESTPRTPEDDDQYSKVVSWIRRSDHLPAKVDFYDRKGKLLKTLTTDDITTIEGIPTPRRMEMANKQTGARTVLEFADIDYNSGLDDSIFEKRQLEIGPPS